MRRLTGLLALLLTVACVPLVPYEELRTRLPAGSLFEVAGHTAHVVRSGAGEPVVLLHGFGASSYSWRHVTAALADRYELIAIDLNGHGFTERTPDLDAYTVGGQLALILGVMDELGLDSAHFAGHSYGGALAANLAWRHPERVRTLILVGSAGVAYPWERRTVAAAFPPLTWLFVRTLAIRRDNIADGLARSFADDSAVSSELVDAYHERVRVEGVARGFRGLTRPTSEPRDLPELERLDLPVLMVWGAEDTLTIPEAGRRASEILPRATFELLDGVGHIPPEESPAELAQLMRDFLARNRPADSRAG